MPCEVSLADLKYYQQNEEIANIPDLRKFVAAMVKYDYPVKIRVDSICKFNVNAIRIYHEDLKMRFTDDFDIAYFVHIRDLKLIKIMYKYYKDKFILTNLLFNLFIDRLMDKAKLRFIVCLIAEKNTKLDLLRLVTSAFMLFYVNLNPNIKLYLYGFRIEDSHEIRLGISDVYNFNRARRIVKNDKGVKYFLSCYNFIRKTF
jgi:hypothetical protein